MFLFHSITIALEHNCKTFYNFLCFLFSCACLSLHKTYVINFISKLSFNTCSKKSPSISQGTLALYGLVECLHVNKPVIIQDYT